MKNKVIKVVKQEKLLKSYLQVISDTCFKIAVLELCSQKKTRQSAVGSFRNTGAIAVHW